MGATIRFGDTYGLAQDSEGRIYVAHTVHSEIGSKDAVCVFGEDSRFVTSWGGRFAGGAHGLDIRKEKGGAVSFVCENATSTYNAVCPVLKAVPLS